MSQTKPLFTRPVTKKPDDLAVPRLPGVCLDLESMQDAFGGGGSDAGAGAAEGVPEFVTPPSNTGVNKILSLAQGSK